MDSFILYDLPNLLGILIVITISSLLGWIPSWLAFCLGIFSFTPFFLNDFLFPASYMPDQFKYLSIVQSLRVFSLDYDPYATTVHWASWMLNFVPLPFVETIYSLGFYNRFILTVLVIWLYASKKIRGWPLFFILFYPSLLLYSSLALRETLVLGFMLVSVVLFIEKRHLLAIAIVFPLLFIKFQNFYLMLIFFVMYLSFTRGTFFYRIRYFFLPSTVLLLFPFLNEIIERLDYLRLVMFLEDNGDKVGYIPIKSIADFVTLGVQSSPYFLMKPFPWEASNILQLIQSLENLLLLGFLVLLFFRVSKIDKGIALKWALYLFVVFTIYGLVVSNYGTAVRYKFSFIVIVVVGMAYEVYLTYGLFISARKIRKN